MATIAALGGQLTSVTRRLETDSYRDLPRLLMSPGGPAARGLRGASRG